MLCHQQVFTILLLVCLTLPSKLYLTGAWPGNTHFETYVTLKLLLKLMQCLHFIQTSS